MDRREREALDRWITREPDEGIEPGKLVEMLMTDEERETFLERVGRLNPSLRGASVWDVLEIACDADAYISTTEPLAEEFGDEWTATHERAAIVLAVLTMTRGTDVSADEVREFLARADVEIGEEDPDTVTMIDVSTDPNDLVFGPGLKPGSTGFLVVEGLGAWNVTVGDDGKKLSIGDRIGEETR